MVVPTIDTCASIKRDTVAKRELWAQGGVAFYSTAIGASAGSVRK